MEPSKEAFSQPSVGPVEGQDFSDLVDGKMEEPGSKKKTEEEWCVCGGLGGGDSRGLWEKETPVYHDKPCSLNGF